MMGVNPLLAHKRPKSGSVHGGMMPPPTIRGCCMRGDNVPRPYCVAPPFRDVSSRLPVLLYVSCYLPFTCKRWCSVLRLWNSPAIVNLALRHWMQVQRFHLTHVYQHVQSLSASGTNRVFDSTLLAVLSVATRATVRGYHHSNYRVYLGR